MEALWNIYRDTNQKEIDMVIEEAGIVHPVEIKKQQIRKKGGKSL